ncbi:hypothetical protein ACHAQJ_003501 [Trichoderma viride]
MIWTWDTKSSLRTTTKTGIQLHTLQLDPSYPEYLVTGAGPILMENLKDNGSVQITPTEGCPYGITMLDEDSEEAWITWPGKKVIFLPKAYRGGIAQVWDRRVAIGLSSNLVLTVSSIRPNSV